MNCSYRVPPLTEKRVKLSMTLQAIFKLTITLFFVPSKFCISNNAKKKIEELKSMLMQWPIDRIHLGWVGGGGGAGESARESARV